MKLAAFLSAAPVAIGLALAGYFIGDGFLSARIDDRYVTVKGLAERDVVADMANWPLTFSASGEDLRAVQTEIEEAGETVRRFLLDAGFEADEIAVKRIEVQDMRAMAFRPESRGPRFIVRQTLHVRSGKVALVEAAARRVGELIGQGIVLTGGAAPSYAFSGLNDIKPEMIADAIQAARAGADQFAKESGSRVGAIRRANQGVFSILPRDRGYEWGEDQHLEKRVRVVSTVDFYLKD